MNEKLSYRIILDDSLEGLGEAIKSLERPYRHAIVITDKDVAARFGREAVNSLNSSGLTTELFALEPGEKFKTLDSAAMCLEVMHQKGLDRRSLVIALGGGVVGDLVGFVASCYMRGVDLVQVPTTLMAMVDSAVGGKTGVNLASGKNIVGTFHHPQLVFSALDTLNSLPQREMSAGLAEVIKYGVIQDAAFFEQLEKQMPALLAKDKAVLESVIKHCCQLKLSIVEQDEREAGQRSILNFGHTFGHALEATTHYNRVVHGEAVSIGMSCAGYLSVVLGLTTVAEVQRVETLCQLAGLPTQLPADVSDESLVSFMRGDKKADGGKIRCIVMHAIGKVERVFVEESVILRALRDKRDA